MLQQSHVGDCVTSVLATWLFVPSCWGLVQMRGEGTDNQYHMSPIVARVPIGMKYNHRIMISNPHSKPLEVKEVGESRGCVGGTRLGARASQGCRRRSPAT